MNNDRLHAITNWRLPATMDYTGLNYRLLFDAWRLTTLFDIHNVYFFDQHKIYFDTSSGKEAEN